MWTMFSSRSKIDQTLMIAILLSSSLLAGAHIFEALGYPPCELCLDQREAHWTALATSSVGLTLSIFTKARITAIAAVGAVAMIYLISAILAGYHTGVEFYFWPGPSSCGTSSTIAVEGLNLENALDQGPTGPSCAEALWRFLGVSMAGYNMLFSTAIFAFCTYITLKASRSAKKNRL